jgi:hypothetical protein
VEGSALSETKEETAHSRSWRCRSIDHSRNFCPHRSEKQDDRDTPGPLGNLSGSRLGRAALRREQRKPLESNNPENRATEEKGKTVHRRHKHSPRKRREHCSV